MKKIEPVTIWKNGKSQEANRLYAYITNDNLQNACTFYYSLNSSGEGTEEMPLIIHQMLTEGSVIIEGENYQLWNGSNDDAYSYIATKLNLTLVPETT